LRKAKDQYGNDIDIPDNPDYDQTSGLTTRMKDKLYRKELPPYSGKYKESPPHVEEYGIAGKIADDVRGRCPKCKEWSLLREGKSEGCEKCGYHNVPHAGTPKKKLIPTNKAKDQFGNEIDLPDVPKKLWYENRLTPRDEIKLKRKNPDTVRNFLRGKDLNNEDISDWQGLNRRGMADKFVSDLGYLHKKCPMCGEQLYQNVDEYGRHNEACADCGYNNLEHKGRIDKAWTEFIKAKDQFGNETDLLPDLPEPPPKKPWVQGYRRSPAKALSMTRRQRGGTTTTDELEDKFESDVKAGGIDLGGGASRHLREGELEDIISRESQTCPVCDKKNMLEDDDGNHFCTSCGYHDVPHAGTPKDVAYYKEPGWPVYKDELKQNLKKGWEEYKLKKQGDAAGMIVQTMQDVLDAPIKAGKEFARNLPSSKQTTPGPAPSKGPMENIIGGGANMLRGGVGMVGAYNKYQASQAAAAKAAADKAAAQKKQQEDAAIAAQAPKQPTDAAQAGPRI
jgi:predicted RNA-binding Zn-ribbon protein involved in translation (DUF1610 family)